MNVHQLTSVAQLKANFNVAITAAAVNGTAVDTQGYDRALAIFVSTPSGTGTTSDCKVQEGAASNLSDAADIVGAVFAQATTVGGAVLESLELDLTKTGRLRYIRLVHTGAGGSAAGVASGIIILYRGRYTDKISHTPAVVSV